MINKVASDVTAVLGFTPSKDFDDFVGIEARITEIKSKLIFQSEQVKVMVLVGPPGIGKTSTARVLYNQLSPGFQFSTFLENIKGSYEKPCGNDYLLKLRLQKNLLSEILNQRDIEVRHLGVAQEMLSGKKLLVVLDEVDSWWQLEETAKQRGWFGSGSIIVITTEDRKLLKALRLGVDHIYEMKFPTNDESLQILCQYAFGQNHPDDGFESLAWEVTWLAGNLPLGLRVMGSYLRGMSRDEWIEALPRLRSSLDREIESTLRFSYDALSDKDQYLFLYIACFFEHFKVDNVKKYLEKSGLEVNHGLQVLADKSLIYIEYGSIRMHSLLKQMGRDIVKKQSFEEPGKRAFLWDTMEISDVLEENTGTGSVLGISLMTSEREEIQISKNTFQGMNNLQFLTVNSNNLCIPEGLNCLPDKLRLLHWGDCPMRFWPSKFSGKFLVELIMPNNNFEKLWEGIKPLQCLKMMDLSDSQHLKEIPDLSKATSLEKLDLHRCQNLLELTSSIGNATKLTLCNLSGCLVLKKLPSSMGRLINLEELDLSGCSSLKTSFSAMPCTWSCLYKLDMSGCRNLKEFPNVSDSIVELELASTKIEEIPPWIEKLFRLRKLNMHECKKLKKISPNISKLENLEYLGLLISDSSDDEVTDADVFEAIFKWGPDFERRWTLVSDFNKDYILPLCLPEKARTSQISLNFRCDGLRTIPDCIGRLSGLSKLDISFTVLTSLPRLPDSLLSLDATWCYSLKRIDSTFQNPNICLNFSSCFGLNQKARKLIQTSACKYAVLPGEQVPAHFHHRASSGSLTVDLTPTRLPSSFRFRACFLLSEGNSNHEDHDNDDNDEEYKGVSYQVRGKQNGLTIQYGSNHLHHMPTPYELKHLYIFEDYFSLNQDCPAAEETTLSELSFLFRVHEKTWKVKGCGVQLLRDEENAYGGDDGGDESGDDDGDNDDVEDDTVDGVDKTQEREESGHNEYAETRSSKRIKFWSNPQEDSFF